MKRYIVGTLLTLMAGYTLANAAEIGAPQEIIPTPPLTATSTMTTSGILQAGAWWTALTPVLYYGAPAFWNHVLSKEMRDWITVKARLAAAAGSAALLVYFATTPWGQYLIRDNLFHYAKNVANSLCTY